MKRRTPFLAAACLGFAGGLILAWMPANAQTRFDHQVRNLFFAGFSGDAESLQKGMKACEDVLATNPNHAEALVWHGGGLLMMAGDAFRKNQPNAMELWTKALGEMQKAVELEPKNIGVRIPRGAVLLNTSRFTPKDVGAPLLETGLSDYEATLELQAGHFDKLGTHPRGELLFGLAEGYSRAGKMEKAQQFFERILRDLPETGYSKRAALWLETKSLPANQTGCIGCHVSAKSN